MAESGKKAPDFTLPDLDGTIAKIYEKVKLKDHVEEVLNDIQELQ